MGLALMAHAPPVIRPDPAHFQPMIPSACSRSVRQCSTRHAVSHSAAAAVPRLRAHRLVQRHHSAAVALRELGRLGHGSRPAGPHAAGEQARLDPQHQALQVLRPLLLECVKLSGIGFMHLMHPTVPAAASRSGPGRLRQVQVGRFVVFACCAAGLHVGTCLWAAGLPQQWA